MAAVERAVSAAGHVIVDMKDFPAADRTPAELCADVVRGCKVYVGVLGTRYGSPVRDKSEVSYTELEFDTATEAGLVRLVFLLDINAPDLAIPPSALIDREFGDRQDEFRRRVQESELTTQSFASPAALGQLVERSLRQLADMQTQTGSQIQPSAAESENSLFALASRAQQRWQDALTALQGTARLMDRAERRGAVPPGMDGWEYVDQLAVHKRLAISMAELMMDLESQSERVVQAVKEAKANVDQLRESGFVQLPSRLASMIESVSDLERASSGLLDRMMRLFNDLDNRGCPDYNVSSETLLRGHERIEDAINEANSVTRALQRMQPGSSSPTPDADSAEEQPHHAAPSSQQHKAIGNEVRFVSTAPAYSDTGLKAAAGTPIASAHGDADSVPAPANRLSDSRLVAVKVEGNSMEGARIHDGDYVIVDTEGEARDGDIVVVTIEGPGDPDVREAMVKRIRLKANGSFDRLISEYSDRQEKVSIGPGNKPHVEGKVIGIFHSSS